MARMSVFLGMSVFSLVGVPHKISAHIYFN